MNLLNLKAAKRPINGAFHRNEVFRNRRQIQIDVEFTWDLGQGIDGEDFLLMFLDNFC